MKYWLLIISMIIAGQALSHDVYKTVCDKSEPTQQDQETATLIGGILGWLLTEDSRGAIAGAVIGATTAGEEVCTKELVPHRHEFEWIRVETIIWL